MGSRTIVPRPFVPEHIFLFARVPLVDFLSTAFLTAVRLFHERLFNLTIFENVRTVVSFVCFNLDFNKLNKLSVGIKLHGNFTPRAEVGVDELKLAFTRIFKA